MQEFVYPWGTTNVTQAIMAGSVAFGKAYLGPRCPKRMQLPNSGPPSHLLGRRKTHLCMLPSGKLTVRY